jgi:hypothetical protein
VLSRDCDGIDGRVERIRVVRGWLAEPADLAHVLQRRRPDVVPGDVLDVRLAQGLDTPAHRPEPTA